MIAKRPFFTLLLLVPLFIFATDNREDEKKFPSPNFFEKQTDTLSLLRLKDPQKETCRPFYVLTIPKAGTFLLNKMLVMLTGKSGAPVWDVFNQISHVWKFANSADPSSLIAHKELEKSFKERSRLNEFHLAHMNFAENFLRYSIKHPEYEKIVLIRDLRDVCISAVYYLSEEIEKAIHSNRFDDKLMFIINGGTLSDERGFFDSFWKLDKLADIAAEWIKDPTVTVCRFEDLIGEKGGGSLEAQQRQITEIANALGISLTSKKLDKITSQLFGVKKGLETGATYREGKIGGWAAHFKEEHQEAFNRRLGKVQQKLGYPIF